MRGSGLSVKISIINIKESVEENTPVAYQVAAFHSVLITAIRLICHGNVARPAVYGSRTRVSCAQRE